jgi:hypothetical protein
MSYYNSGRRARELGIGSSGSLPSNPDLEYVFHDQKDLTPETLKKILGRNPTPEDVAAALEIASRPENKNLDTLVRELLKEGGKHALKQEIKKRMAGEVLAGAGGLAGLLAAVDYVDGPEQGRI